MIGTGKHIKRGNREFLWVKAEMESLQALASHVRDWLLTQEEYRNDTNQSYLVELAVVEGCTNIIRHAYDASCREKLGLSIKRSGDEIEILLMDKGVPFDPTRAPLPNLDEPGEGGYGVFLIREIMREVSYQRRGSLWNVLLLKHDVPTRGKDASFTTRTIEQNPGSMEKTRRSGAL